MAERRMFSKTVTDSDTFLDMPATSQLLYFHLSMHADDDGFLKNPKSIMRMVGGNNDDLKLLVAKQFLIPFESGVVVIKHWKIHNYIAKDRYKPSDCEEKKMVTLDKNVYSLCTDCIQPVYELDTNAVQNGYKMDTQDRLGKDRLDNTCITNVIHRRTENATQEKKVGTYDQIMDAWNALSDYGIKPIRTIEEGTKRMDLLRSRIRQYGEPAVLEAIEKIKSSDFLQGNGARGWAIYFDWFIRPGNFPKVLEGNYDNAKPQSSPDSAPGQRDLYDDGSWMLNGGTPPWQE